MPIVRPRDAASVMLVRDLPSGEPAVLMGRRSRRASFIPDMFVFPGGRVDPADQHIELVSPLSDVQAGRLAIGGGAAGALARRVASAAIRETWEETGYHIGASSGEDGTLKADHGALHFAARAITPRESPIRFHARFFIADGTGLTGAPAGSGELSDLTWFLLSEAQRLPVIDVTEFMLAQLATLRTDHSRIPLFTYRGGRPAIRWTGLE